MEALYILNPKHSKDETCYSFVGLDKQTLYYISVEKEINENKTHHFLQKSFEYCKIDKNEDLLDSLFSKGRIYSENPIKKKDYKLVKISNQPGIYYPRIYRPYLEPNEIISLKNSSIQKLEKIVLNKPDYYPFDINLIISGLNQLSVLSDMLSDILNTIHPTSQNLKTYGQDIKNLLVLSCIEVEAQLKGIYKANEISSKLNYSTKDYIKLKNLMQLDKYSVRLPLYPELQLNAPFKNWNEKVGPTKSIQWYDNYNAVKHNSETEFCKATLESAIQSICAVAVLLHAQYGPEIPYWKDEIGSYYEIIDNTSWSLKDKVLPPFKGESWQKKKIGL